MTRYACRQSVMIGEICWRRARDSALTKMSWVSDIPWLHPLLLIDEPAVLDLLKVSSPSRSEEEEEESVGPLRSLGVAWLWKWIRSSCATLMVDSWGSVMIVNSLMLIIWLNDLADILHICERKKERERDNICVAVGELCCSNIVVATLLRIYHINMFRVWFQFMGGGG